MKTMRKSAWTLSFVATLLLALNIAAGCQRKKSPGEKLGEAIEDAGDAIEDAAD